MNRHRDRIARLALAAVLTVTTAAWLAACTDNGGGDVQTKAPEQATAQVKDYAEAIRAAAGVDAFSERSENVTSCEGRLGELSDPDEVYYIQGIYQLLVPAEEQAATRTRVRQQWERDGLRITGERTFGTTGTGEVKATADGGYTLALTSGEPPAMLLLVSSPCYRRP